MRRCISGWSYVSFRFARHDMAKVADFELSETARMRQGARASVTSCSSHATSLRRAPSCCRRGQAAYRCLDNPSVNELLVLAGQVWATRSRARATRGPLRVLHDATEFSFRRDDVDALGVVRPQHGRLRACARMATRSSVCAP